MQKCSSLPSSTPAEYLGYDVFQRDVLDGYVGDGPSGEDFLGGEDHLVSRDVQGKFPVRVAMRRGGVT